MTTQDPELSAALGWPGGISDPVLDRAQLLQMVAALRLSSQQALEFFDAEFGWSPGEAPRIDNLRAALAQQDEPVEPVAWIYQNMYTEQEYLVWKKGTGGRNWRPLYAAPPQRKPLPLKTVEKLIYENTKISPNVADDRELLGYIVNAVRAVERAYGIGETQ